MALIGPLLGARLSFILGITNIIGLLLVLGSCRCILGWQPKFLQSRKWFMSFYGYHCWYWRLFLLSVFLHALVSIATFGYPF